MNSIDKYEVLQCITNIIINWFTYGFNALFWGSFGFDA